MATTTPPTLQLIPQSLPIYSVIGSTVAFNLTATSPDGTPFDLTGWSITAPFVRRPPLPDPPPTPLPPPLPIQAWLVAFDPATAPNVITCSLEATDTAIQLPCGATSTTLEWAVWIVSPDTTQTIELLRGSLNLVPP